ncbi:hypothetical protein ACWG0P_07230 [Amedibacillus sp. YH-ame6]
MNAVDIVRENSACDNFHNIDYAKGFYNALDKVQAELDKEVPCDWEAERLSLKKEIDKLTVMYKSECELSSRHATTIMKQSEEIMQKDKELNELRAKWEAVQLIFGGK